VTDPEDVPEASGEHGARIKSVMLGRRGGYTRVDGPEAVLKAAGEYVVIDASNARGGQAAAAARMIRKMSRRRRGEQFLSATDIRGEVSVAAASTFSGMSRRQTADDP
jgi:hypothetical protein